MKKLILLIFILVAINANAMYKSHMDKKVFLETNPSFYTINLSTIYYYDGYKDFIEDLGTSTNVFVFEYGDKEDAKVAKVLFGVFKTYKEALVAVNKLPTRLRNNKPYINKMGKFQELFKRYHNKKEALKHPVPQKDMKAMVAAKKANEKNKNKKQPDNIYVDENQGIKSIGFIASLKEVLTTNPTVLEQNTAVDIVKNEIDIAMASFLPTVDFSQTKTDYSNASDNTGATLQTDATTKDITANWNLFNGMQDYHSYKVVHTKYKSALLSRQETVDKVIIDFIKAFTDFLKQKEIYDLGDRDLAAYDKYIKKKKLQNKYGMTSMSKTAAIDKKYLTAQIRHLESNKKKYMDSLFELQRYIRINKDTNVIKDFNKIKIDVSGFSINSVSSVALNSNPKLLQAKNEILLAKQKLSKEYKNFMPTVDFIVKKSEISDTYTDRIEKTGDTTLKLQTKINLFSGGKDYNNIKKNINMHKQKQIEYDNIKRKTIFNAQTSLNEYQNLEERSLLVKQLLISADQAYVAAEFDYSYAKIDEDGLLAAMESLYSAEKDSIEFKYDTINSKFKMLYNLGIIQEKIQESIKAEGE